LFRLRWRLDRLQGDDLATVVAIRVDILRRHLVMVQLRKTWVSAAMSAFASASLMRGVSPAVA
jgi:hypothetical protein